MPEPRRASKRARRACRGMPEPAWRSPDAGYVQGRLRGALVARAQRAKFAGGIDKHLGKLLTEGSNTDATLSSSSVAARARSAALAAVAEGRVGVELHNKSTTMHA
eukprot:scaffold132197_cov72-Phaeocystis_antarctica.AAC.1